jgi:hypothetical protein
VEWHEAKRQENVAKHGVDFRDAALIFDAPYVAAEDTRRDYGERRWQAVGHVEGREYYFVVYTRRPGDVIRIISAWRAGNEDKRRYQELLARGLEGDARARPDPDAR